MADVWVVPVGDVWGLRREFGDLLGARYETKAEALTAGRELARAEGVELIWLGRDGRIQGRDSYGGDSPRRPG